MGYLIFSMHPSQKLKSQFVKLRAQKVPWKTIFAQSVGDFTTVLRLLFTKNSKAKNQFTKIMSDFYTRPAYWSDLFSASLDSMSVNYLGIITNWSTKIPDQRISAIVASQFADRSESYVAVRYAGVPATSQIDIVQALGGADIWDIAKSFYHDYFMRYASDYEVILFWQMMLNSAISDLMKETTEEKISTAVQAREEYVQTNLRPLARQLKSSQALLDTISIQSQQIYIRPQTVSQIQRVMPNFDPMVVAEKILLDASDNWIFNITLSLDGGNSLTNYPIVGPKYIAEKVRIRGRNILESGRSFVMAREWMENFLNRDEFETLLFVDDVLQPVSIILSNKPDRAYEIKPISLQEATVLIASFHSVLPELSVRGFAFAIGAYDDAGRIAGILTLNTPVAAIGGSPGYYHLIEVSRIAVAPGFQQQGISSLLLRWAIDNKDLFNRSSYPTKLVTYSMLDEPGYIYSRNEKLSPVALVRPGARDKGSNVAITSSWKIRWETGVDPSQAAFHLPAIHQPYLKYSKGVDSYSGRRLTHSERSLKTHNLRQFKSVAQLKDLGRVLGINFSRWKSRAGKSAQWYENRNRVQEIKRELIHSLNISIPKPLP